MNIDKLKRAQEKIVAINKIEAEISRQQKQDNGRGALIPTGVTTKHKITCRICDVTAGLWAKGNWDGGMFVNRPKYAVCNIDADIMQNDILKVSETEAYRVGVVSSFCLRGQGWGKQAQLFEA
jgi:hypothetical protein